MEAVFYHKGPNIKMETFSMKKKYTKKWWSLQTKAEITDTQHSFQEKNPQKKQLHDETKDLPTPSHYYTLHSLTKSSGIKRWAGMTGGMTVRLTRSKSTPTDLTMTSTEVEEHSNA